jgi:hypothetical protein
MAYALAVLFDSSAAGPRGRGAAKLPPCRDWLKVKTQAWREANRERWRLFEERR